MSGATGKLFKRTKPLEARRDAAPGALWFERIVVRRMPGIGGGGFKLDGLTSGINIVHGPNASGKTTTARAIESLLWPRSAAVPRAILEGRFRIGAEEWGVEVEGAHARYLRGGQEASAPVVPPAETRDRYHLSLHELLASENRALADEIMRESAGGYDLGRAAGTLYLRDGPSRKGKEATALEEARRKLRLALEEQEKLQAEERRLRELTEELEAAEAAERRVLVLRRAVEHAEAEAAEAEARAAVEAFPPEMAVLRGDEAGRLEEIRKRLDEIGRRLGAVEQDRREAEAELVAAELPPEGVERDVLTSLKERRDEIRGLETGIANHARELEGARTAAAEELRRIGEVTDEAALGELDVVRVDELEAFAEEAGAARAAVLAAEARLHLLEARDGEKGTRAGHEEARTGHKEARAIDPERLDRGIWILRQWLRGHGVEKERGWARRLRIPVALLVIPAVLGGLHLTGAGLGALGVALVGLVLLLALLWPRGAETEARDARRRDYLELGLEAPGSWTEAGVVERLDRLESLRAELRMAEARAADRRAVAAEVKASRARWAEIEERRTEMAARFGVAPELDPAALHAFVNRLSRWQDATARVASLEAERERLESERAAKLEAAAAVLARFGYTEIVDHAGLAGAIEGLEARLGKQASALQRRATAESQAEEARGEIARLLGERGQILARFGWQSRDAVDGSVENGAAGVGVAAAIGAALAASESRGDVQTPDDPEAVLRDWCARHGDYKEAVGRLREAVGARASAHKRLVESSGYTPGLESEPFDALRSELSEAEERAERVDELREAISGIRARIDVARQGHAVEDALAEVERREAALREVMDRDILGVVGKQLVEHVQRATRDQHRPEVFHRARSLFSTITRHRYRLEFEDGAEPAFRALDTETEELRELDELSSATRVQLLLAVRLAFVESREGVGARLPLVFDETLGNSDDARAAAIIDATIALAAEGRQVFYFTAQPDEVAKWRAALERHSNLPSAVIDLAAARRFSRHEASPPLVAAPRRPTPLEPPATRDYFGYGQLLEVPGIALDDEVGAVHLWHLVDSPELLHRLLLAGFESWGPLRSVVENGGGAILGQDLEAFPGIEAAARALETALELARVGRGRPVDMAAIRESGAVSENFIDAVEELIRELDGHAGRLIRAIEDGGLPRFRTNRREQLREFLEREGYLDPRDPVPPEELESRVLASVGGEIAAGVIRRELVDRIVRQVVGGAEIQG